jgi:hypothetical protein
MGWEAKDRAQARRRWRAVGLILGTVVLGIGCGPLNAISFLLQGDPRIPPDYPLTSKDNREVKIVVLASATGLDPRPETYGGDQELAERLIQALRKCYAEDRQRVTIVPAYQVHSYQNKSTGAQTPYEVGKHFQADKVINLEVGPLSLYKQGSARTLFQGQIEVSVSVTDMSRPPEDGPIFRKEHRCEYPKIEEPADGRDPAVFRAKFLDFVARDLSHFFTPHDARDERMGGE